MDEGSELPLDDHDRLVRLEAQFSATCKRLDEFVDWKHVQLPPIIMGLQKDVLEQAKASGTLRGEVAALVGAVDKLAAAVQLLIGTPAALAEHEGSCIRARAEDIVHRTRHESWVADQFAGIRTRQLALHGTVGFAMASGLATMAWYILTHLHVGIP